MWGAVESSATYDFEAFTDLPTETQRQDFHCVTGWSRFDSAFTGVPFPALAERVGLDGEPLPAEHGGPVRVVTPHRYAYKGAKWVTGIEVLTEPERGYWERRGYSDSADPWREERYA